MATTLDRNPVTRYPSDDFPRQEQEQPGLTSLTEPTPDHGEDSYVGSGRLTGMRALITGGDSGIGRAVAIAFAREGADVAISYLPDEEDDAADTARRIEDAGRTALRLPGDVRSEQQCAELVQRVVDELGGLDILVLNAAYQQNRDGLENTPTEEIERVFETNLFAPMWTARAAIPHLEPGSSIITTSSIQAFNPSPQLIDYAMTKAAQVAFTKALAQQLGGRGIRVNAVAPGPIWTPLIPATSWPDKLPTFGQDTPLGRAGQPAELAPAYVFLASPESSYVSGAIVPVTGGKGCRDAGWTGVQPQGPRVVRGAAQGRGEQGEGRAHLQRRRIPGPLVGGPQGRQGGDYDDWTVPDLRTRAKELGIEGYSRKRKSELISMLRNH